MNADHPIGRDDDLTAVVDHLANGRLVTILGTGGLGKTTLARSVAATANEHAWVDLAALVDDDDLVSSVARALGASSIDGWAVAQADRTPLLVLDNCEPVLAAAADVAARILELHPTVRILSTSRVELGLPGEIRYRLAPLSVRRHNGELSDAAALFRERCRAAGAAWPDSAPNLDAIEAVVAAVDGLPLAIELAAAQSVAVSPAQLRPLFEDSLSALDGPANAQRTRLADVITASHRRLRPEAQRLFRAVSIVPGDFDLDLAAALGAMAPLEALELLGELLRESLLTVHHDDDGGSRFRLLEPIRHFARDALDDADETDLIEDRFVDAMAALADEVVASALGSFDPAVLSAAADRFGHIARAIEGAIRRDTDPARAYRLFLPLFAPSSGSRAVVAALGRKVRERWPEDESPLRAEALAVIAHTEMNVGADDVAASIAADVLEDGAASPLGRLLAHRTLGSIAAFADDYDRATSHLTAAIDEADRFGGLFAREMRATRAGFRLDDLSSLDELVVLCDQCAVAEDHATLGWVLVAMINIQLQNGRVAEAERHLDRAEIAAARSPLRWSASSVARSRAIIESASDDWTNAAAAWLRCLDLMVSWGDAEGIGVCLRTASASAERCGEHEVAEALWRARPAGRANTILPRPFLDHEDALLARCGPPVPMSLAEAVAAARLVLRVDEAPGQPPKPSTAEVLRFGSGYELDLGRYELRQDGHVIHVEPQVFDVLVHLARNTGQLVRREELMDEVWGTRFVTAAAVSSRIRSARAAVGDDGRRQAVIRTVHGRGFEFVAAVETTAD